MNILVVSSFLPYPLFSGGHIRLYNLIKLLSKKHSIILVCEKRSGQTEQDVNELRKICKEVIVVPRKKQWSLGNIVTAGVSLNPFLITGHTSNEMKQKIQAVLEKEKIDVVHVETFYVLQNVPKTQLPIVLVEHNIEYLVYLRYMQNAPIFLRPFLWYDILKLRKAEEKAWTRATKVVAVSPIEQEVIGKNTALVANGVDLQNFKFQLSSSKFQPKEKRILFIGSFKWVQNKNAAEYILKNIWPLVLKEKYLSDLTLWIVGKNIPDNLKNIETSRVIFDENASEETAEIYKQSFMLLAPIWVGGGTSYKILEAMASGVPVITTNLGVEGIDARKEVVIASSPADFVAEIKNLLNEKVYSKISTNARKKVEEEYRWETIVNDLEKVYKSVL